MPTEIRQISFRAAEVAEAITTYYRKRSTALPAGDLGIEILDDGMVSAAVSIRGQSGKTTEIQVNSETLAAALILYCISRHIPIPSKAEKRLQRVGDSVAIFVMRYALD